MWKCRGGYRGKPLAAVGHDADDASGAVLLLEGSVEVPSLSSSPLRGRKPWSPARTVAAVLVVALLGGTVLGTAVRCSGLSLPVGRRPSSPLYGSSDAWPACDLALVVLFNSGGCPPWAGQWRRSGIASFLKPLPWDKVLHVVGV